MKVIKRNGQKVEFDSKKITAAILKTFLEADGEITDYAKNKAADISKYIEQNIQDNTNIEEIQDMVVKKLMDSSRKDIATRYVEYRHLHKMARDQYADFMNAISEKLQGSNIQNQNANVDEKSFGGRIGEATNLMMKQYALDYCMSDMAKNNHLNNEIYIHDLDHYAVGNHNCLSIPFDHLLAEGFNTRQTDVRPAQSISTALQLVAVIFQLQSLQQFGGVSATHLDWTLAPYVKKSFYKHYLDGLEFLSDKAESDWLDSLNDTLSIDDEKYKKYEDVYKFALKMTTKETYQAVEGMYHNLNTLQSRSGNQLPFTSINYGTCTSSEGRLVIKALLDTSIKGIGKLHRTSIFPCGIFQLGNGINKRPGDPNYDLYRLALKSTAQRLYPNYANIDWSGNAGYDKNDPKTYFSTMGCRTANGFDINADEDVNPQTKDGRGNICPVTIILPTLAMEADRDVSKFLSLLDTKLHEAKDMLIERFNYICSQSAESGKFMYENNLLLGYKPEEGIRSALKHGTLALGMLGVAETLQLLIGKDQTTAEGLELAKKICELYKVRCAQFKQQYKLNFGVYYTPAENLVYTSMLKFKAKYGEIKDVSDKEFFTNSIHVPVWQNMSPIEKINIESQLTGYSSAGCITYVELDSGVKNNIDGLETIVTYAMDKDIPYFAINVPNDTCLECGYTDEFNDICPECGSHNIQQLRRVTGYLSTDYHHFNNGKIAEVSMRVKHR